MKKSLKKYLSQLLFFLIVFGIIITLPYIDFAITNRRELSKSNMEISELVNEIRSETGFRMYYKSKKRDLISFYYQKSNKTKVVVNGEHYILSNEKSITTPDKQVNKSDIKKICSNVQNLKKLSNDNGAKFLYVYAPNKSLFATFPDNVENYSSENYNSLINGLKEKQIETFDLADEMKKENKGLNDWYFVTDSHWKPETGFWANQKICNELKKRYGFNYDLTSTDINNYNIKTYNNWFLGASGKTTGKNFSPLGVDNISLITPKFVTDITEKRPFENETKTGDFSKTIIDMSQIKYKNLYINNCYELLRRIFRRRLQIADNSKQQGSQQ